MDIDTKIINDYKSRLSSTSRLIHICKDVGADTYLSGVGAKAYLNEEEFKENNIQVIYQDVSPEHKHSILTEV